MADPSDEGLQLLLDPALNGRGIRLVKRVDAATLSSYYCQGNVVGKGRAKWVNVTTTDVDAVHDTAIRAAFEVA